MSESAIIDWLKKNLSDEKYRHSIGTANCAKNLALKFNIDPQKAYIAGLLHDCAKCLDKEKIQEYINTKVTLTEDEKLNSKTWHAPIGAHIAETNFDIKDPETLSAIRWHTLGKKDMTVFEKIIFLADKIELETRDKIWCEINNKIIEEPDGLNKAILNCYNATIKSLCERNLKICKSTIDIYNELLDTL